MKQPLVIIFHSPLADNAPPDELDVLDEAAYFRKGLEMLGYRVMLIPFCYDLRQLGELLGRYKPLFVVNLVETLFTDGRLVHLAPSLFEHFGVRYTGCRSEAMYVTSNKVLAKKLMLANGIPTPVYLQKDDILAQVPLSCAPYIVKSIWEHASFGLDEEKTLLYEDLDKLAERFEHEAENAGSFFAEAYVHGREFNISLLDSRTGPEVLPVAEMRFDYPDDKPRIVGYRAKWDTGSFEYQHTARQFFSGGQEADLARILMEISLKCWKVFGLSGYARVDFRVDMHGNAYVLEVNANPCISEDSGFVAAARQAGLDSGQLVKRITEKLAD